MDNRLFLSGKSFTYFEQKPADIHLDDATYEKCSLGMGRPCLDVGFIVDKKLVLVERSVEPGQGLWMAGGRIKWGKFENVYQYAGLTAKEHFGIDTIPEYMTLLHPRFICFKNRPYPEIILWVLIKLETVVFEQISLDTTEQKRLLTFATQKQLSDHLLHIKTSPEHCAIFLDLWDELTVRKLLE